MVFLTYLIHFNNKQLKYIDKSKATIMKNKPVGDVVRSLTYLYSGAGIVGKNLLT